MPLFGKKTPDADERARDYLRDIGMATPSVSFTSELAFHRECARRPEVLCYLSDFSAQARAGVPWAKAAAFPFTAGLVAGVRLASEPDGDDGETESAFQTAMQDFPRPEVDRVRHDDMAERYETRLRSEEGKQGYDRKKLLDIESRRDPRVEGYVNGSLRGDNISKAVIGAFTAGLVAGSRLLVLGHVERIISS